MPVHLILQVKTLHAAYLSFLLGQAPELSFFDLLLFALLCQNKLLLLLFLSSLAIGILFLLSHDLQSEAQCSSSSQVASEAQI